MFRFAMQANTAYILHTAFPVKWDFGTKWQQNNSLHHVNQHVCHANQYSTYNNMLITVRNRNTELYSLVLDGAIDKYL